MGADSPRENAATRSKVGKRPVDEMGGRRGAPLLGAAEEGANADA